MLNPSPASQHRHGIPRYQVQWSFTSQGGLLSSWHFPEESPLFHRLLLLGEEHCLSSGICLEKHPRYMFYTQILQEVPVTDSGLRSPLPYKFSAPKSQPVERPKPLLDLKTAEWQPWILENWHIFEHIYTRCLMFWRLILLCISMPGKTCANAQ